MSLQLAVHGMQVFFFVSLHWSEGTGQALHFQHFLADVFNLSEQCVENNHILLEDDFLSSGQSHCFEQKVFLLIWIPTTCWRNKV